MKVVVDSAIPFLEGVLEPFAIVEYHSAESITAAVVADADALIIRTRTRCNRALLEGSKVQFIATATIGFDHIDQDYCREAGIHWVSCPGCNAQAVCDYVEEAIASSPHRLIASSPFASSPLNSRRSALYLSLITHSSYLNRHLTLLPWNQNRQQHNRT